MSEMSVNTVQSEFKVSLRLPAFFISLALLFFISGLFFGLIGSFQYIFPEWMRNSFPFSRVRPLHVSMVISWIFCAASGGIYFYIQEFNQRPLYSAPLAWTHGVVLAIVSLITFAAYSSGKFGGREYLEFPVLIAVPLIFYWIIFMINYFKTQTLAYRVAPVYVWMWATGLIFFLLTFLESQLWILKYFSANIVRDTTVQWKALGSMVGSWNMLVYGTAFYLMEKVGDDSKVSRSPMTFFFYFLGLTNLMFNWGHHTYIVPASPWIRNVAYVISMTELLILANIIRVWRASLNDAKKNFHILPYRFLVAADFWIFLNLILAILMSVPAINAYTHGTHITVAHAMGTTIGINTMILLSSVTFLSEKISAFKLKAKEGIVKTGFWISNISLLIFWIALLLAGFIKFTSPANELHQQLMLKQKAMFYTISVSGTFMILGFYILIWPLFKINILKLTERKQRN